MSTTIQASVHPPDIAGEGRQSFFLAYAQQWCHDATWLVEMTAATGSVHAPNHVRVNAVLGSFPEFGEAFQCKPGTPMRATPCEVW